MKTAEEILKQEVLKVTNGVSFEHNITHEGIVNAMKEYALEVAREALKNASENATTEYGKFSDGSTGTFRVVDKDSILSERNIPKEVRE